MLELHEINSKLFNIEGDIRVLNYSTEESRTPAFKWFYSTVIEPEFEKKIKREHLKNKIIGFFSLNAIKNVIDQWKQFKRRIEQRKDLHKAIEREYNLIT